MKIILQTVIILLGLQHAVGTLSMGIRLWQIGSITVWQFLIMTLPVLVIVFLCVYAAKLIGKKQLTISPIWKALLLISVTLMVIVVGFDLWMIYSGHMTLMPRYWFGQVGGEYPLLKIGFDIFLLFLSSVAIFASRKNNLDTDPSVFGGKQ